ncbi:MAG TPA: tetratricopeptide repeat protein [Polyangia bacterium]|nr:tetratricopeptide repeat protein [Polyangia bacterium]
MRDRLAGEAIRRRARVLLDLGRPADALVEVRRALAISPLDPEALEIEGLCHLRLSDYPAALGSLGRAIAEAPDGAHAHYLYGFALRESGRAGDAEAPFRDALRLAPDEPVYLRALAELYADLGRYPEALASARRATEVAPERAANHVTYGYVASAAGDKQLARAEYERAVTLDPNDSAAWNNLGCLDLEAGRALRARLRFREALRLDPQGGRARRNLAMAAPRRPPPRTRSWDGTVEEILRELIAAGARRTLLAAVLVEAPSAASALVRGGRTGAAISGVATLMALRAMGPAAIGPLAVGALAAGAAWLVGRNRLAADRARVKAALTDGRAEFDTLWAAWLAGGLGRDARDAAIDLLVEKIAFELVEGST